ncbi:MAG TPA: alpha/beta hydrolase [Gemmataceae bacterium]|nr:alpha/beta hydrolase [Gemmataceae bacterium]
MDSPRFGRAHWRPQLLFWLVGVATVLAAGPAWASERVKAPTAPWPVEEHLNISYCDGPADEAEAHLCDVFMPKGKKNFPVVVLLHGGAWTIGDKSWGGAYSNVGRCLARLGIGAVLPNYRLAPAARFPAQVEDAAAAVAWTIKNSPRYGADPTRLILLGHSAGGHLAALLATDTSYLKRAGVDPARIKGVIAVSGVYRIPDMEFHWQLPWQKSMGTATTALKSGLGWGFDVNPFRQVFGDDPKVLRAASPLSHVHRGLPPFLLVNAGHDFPLLPQMTVDFAAALRKAGDTVRTLTVPDRNHESVLFRANIPTDPCMRAMLSFIERYTRTSGHGCAASKAAVR